MTEPNHASVEKGYYVHLDPGFVGIFPSKEGPQLYYNRETYPLCNNHWDVELVLGKESSLFAFYWNGEVKISLKVEKHLEFFLWLFNLLDYRTKFQLFA